MKNLIYLTLLFLCSASFTNETSCVDKILLGLNKYHSVKKIHNALKADENYKVRDEEYRAANYFEARYFGKSCFINSDSILIYVAKTTGGDIKNPRQSVNINLIVFSAFFPDSTTLYKNYNNIIDKLCSNLTWSEEGPVVDQQNIKVGVGRECLLKSNSRPTFDVSTTGKMRLDIMYSENR